MIELAAHADGIVLPVRARAGGRRSGIQGEQGGALKVSVTQVAEKGKANKAILVVLSKELGLRKSQIDLVAGQTSPDKRFLVRRITRQELEERIRRAMTG